MDKPLGQIGLPLVAAGVSAYSPRYGAAGVQGGLAGLNAVQNYRMDQAQRAHYDSLDAENRAQTQRLNEEAERKRQLSRSLYDQVQGLPGGSSDAGGSAPATQAALQGAGLANDEVPEATTDMPNIPPQLRQLMGSLALAGQTEEVSKMLGELVKPKTPKYTELGEHVAPGGQAYSSMLEENSGRTFSLIHGDTEPNNEIELLQRDPALYAQLKKSQGGAGASESYDPMQIYNDRGEATIGGYDRRRNRVVPATMPPGFTNVGRVGQDPNRMEHQMALARQLAENPNMDLRAIASRGDYSAIMAEAIKLNPSIDAQKIQRAVETEKLFSSGREGQAIKSLDTFMQHGADLIAASNLTDRTGVPIINRSISWMKQNLSGDPQFADFFAALEPVGFEYGRFLTNQYALQDSDRQMIRELLNPNMTVGQVIATVKRMSHTVGAQWNSMNQRFATQTGYNLGANRFSPEGQRASQVLGLNIMAQASGLPQRENRRMRPRTPTTPGPSPTLTPTPSRQRPPLESY